MDVKPATDDVDPDSRQATPDEIAECRYMWSCGRFPLGMWVIARLEATEARVATLESAFRPCEQHPRPDVNCPTCNPGPELALECAVLTARVKELEEARQWRPIETAPKDERQVIVLYRNGAVMVTSYCGGWSVVATHWQPLPAPPAP